MALQTEAVAAAGLVGGTQTALHSHAGGGGPAFPVGAIYSNITGVNPATELGYGTWTAFGTGRFPVGYDAGDADYNAAEKTGGAKTVTLDVTQMPAHTHLLQRYPTATGGSSGFTADTSMSGTPADTTLATKAAGGGLAHPNVPPYIVWFMWKRVA